MIQNAGFNDGSIKELFADLTATLYKVKSCNVKGVNEVSGKGNLSAIEEQIFKFPASVAISYINTTVAEIDAIKLLGEDIGTNVRKDIECYFNGEEMEVNDPTPEISEQENKQNYLLFIKNWLSNMELRLNSLKEAIVSREALLETSSKSKLRLDLSVEEIGAIFRGFKEAGIIDLGNSSLSRFIAQNFESKAKENISEANVKNKLDTITGTGANSALAILDRAASEIKKLRDK